MSTQRAPHLALIAALVMLVVVACGAPSEPSSGADVKIGTAYEYELYTHCGGNEAKFAGVFWKAAAGASASDWSASDWGDPFQQGEMTRISETSAVFRAEDKYQRFVLRPGATEFIRICA